MIKFSQINNQGHRIIGLGITLGNVTYMREGSAIQFAMADLGLNGGIFIIASDKDPLVPQYQAMLGDGVEALHILGDDAFKKLGAGDIIETPLADLGSNLDATAFLFLGESEQAMIAQFRQAGLITEETHVSDPGPWVGEVLSTHTLSWWVAMETLLPALLSMVVGGGLLTLALMGDLKKDPLGHIVGLLFMAGGGLLGVPVYKNRDMAVEIGTLGVEYRLKGKTYRGLWRDLVSIQYQQRREGKLFWGEKLVTIGAILTFRDGTQFWLERRLSGWKTVLKSITKATGSKAPEKKP